MRRARDARYAGSSSDIQLPAGGCTKSGSARYWPRSAKAIRAASVYRCSQSGEGSPFCKGSVAALVWFRMPRIWPTAMAPELGGGKPQMR
jgi:hypothetical protein